MDVEESILEELVPVQLVENRKAVLLEPMKN